MLSALLIAVAPLRAQIIADGATNTLSNVANTITGDVTVGTNGSFTLFVLSDNALLTNSINGTIGLNTTAKSNEVRLASPSARWRMGNILTVGNNGAFNRLAVSNGALVANGNASTNRHIFSSVLVAGLVVPPGHIVFFRWLDINDTGSDHGMAVDDLIVAFAGLSPQITSGSLNPTNRFLQIFGLGESNKTYGIEAATNLAPPIFWQRIGNNTADSAGVFQFTDTNAPAFPMRFYRALSP